MCRHEWKQGRAFIMLDRREMPASRTVPTRKKHFRRTAESASRLAQKKNDRVVMCPPAVNKEL